MCIYVFIKRKPNSDWLFPGLPYNVYLVVTFVNKILGEHKPYYILITGNQTFVVVSVLSLLYLILFVIWPHEYHGQSTITLSVFF